MLSFCVRERCHSGPCNGLPRIECLQFCHTHLSPEATVQLVHVLQEHCGERGDNEGAVETLRRIIKEREEALDAINVLRVRAGGIPFPRGGR